MGQKMTTVGSGDRGRELGKEARFGAAGKEFDVGNICQAKASRVFPFLSSFILKGTFLGIK